MAAEGNPLSRAAHYYAQGLELPLLQIRSGARLIEGCATMPKACTAEQHRLAGGHSVLTLLDALTLFPQRLTLDEAAPTQARDLKQRFAATDAALMRAAGRYDGQLFARLDAALEVCPSADDDTDNYRAQLALLQEVNLVGFQSLVSAESAQELAAITKEKHAQQQRLRAMPVEDCQAIRKLGEYLMELMNAKLQSWVKKVQPAKQSREFDFEEPKQEPAPKPLSAQEDRVLALAVAGNFVTVVATELQLTAYPESEARIKEIADAVERANPPR
jgi:hypothetical protein